MCSKKTKVERKSAKIKRSVIFIFLPFAKKKKKSQQITVGYLQYIFNIDDKTSVLLGLQNQNQKIYKSQKVSRLFFSYCEKKRNIVKLLRVSKNSRFTLQCNYSFLFQTCAKQRNPARQKSGKIKRLNLFFFLLY